MFLHFHPTRKSLVGGARAVVKGVFLLLSVGVQGWDGGGGNMFGVCYIHIAPFWRDLLIFLRLIKIIIVYIYISSGRSESQAEKRIWSQCAGTYHSY